MITIMLGIPAEDRDRFKTWTDAIYLFMGLSGVPILDALARPRARPRN